MVAADTWQDVSDWFQTPTGGEFLDEWVHGTVEIHTVSAMLRSFDIPVNAEHRRRFLQLADKALREGA